MPQGDTLIKSCNTALFKKGKQMKNSSNAAIAEEKAQAKINLCLDVLRRREDGYHEVSMVMQTLELHDDVIVMREQEEQETGFARKESIGSKKTSDGIRMEIEDLRGMAEGNVSVLPCNADNLMYRAANILKEKTGLTEAVLLKLRKRIPVAAGLAGGSADAAAVLRGMNRLFGLGLCSRELAEIGVKLGADIPYCLMGGTALSEGIGERLTPLPDAPKWPVLLIKPQRGVSTAAVYKALDIANRPKEAHPNVQAVIQAIKEGSLAKTTAAMGNILELVTIQELPEIRGIKEKLLLRGAKGALMSGSGPTVFGLFENEAALQQAAKLFEAEKKEGAGYSDVIATCISGAL